MGFVAKAVFRESVDFIKNMVKGVAYVATHEVVVGAEGEHSDLLYLHEAGVPSRNIPPRPVLEPALGQKEVKKSMGRCMRQAVFNAIKGDLEGAENEYNKAGMVGRDACKKYITDGTHLAPNAPSTIAKKGSSVPLIDTGALLNSITYEVRRKGL